MFCTECGQPMADEAKFCAFCGTRRIVPAAAKEAAAPPAPAAKPGAPSVVPPPAPASGPGAARTIRSTAEIMPIRVRAAEQPAPVKDPSRLDFEPLPPIEPEAPWPELESAAPPMPVMPEPPAVSRERVARTPSSMSSAPQPQQSVSRQPLAVPAGFGSVPFAAEPGSPDVMGERRKISPVLIGAIVVAVIALAGIIWMVRSTVSFGGKPAGSVTITIYPTSAKVAPGKGVDFVSEVSGAPSSDVTWSVEEGESAGEIKTRGASAKADTISLYCTYTAPQKPGTYHLVATSTADKSKSATAEIAVAGK